MRAEFAGAVIMVGEGGGSAPERLVQNAQQVAAEVLIERLGSCGVQPVVVAGPRSDWLASLAGVLVDVDDGEFHFGLRLAELIERYDLSPVLYFGAGSAPLLDGELLGLLVGMLTQSELESGGKIPAHIALTNNRHSSDWLGISHARDALPIIRRAARDNSLAWMLAENWDYDVRVLSGMRPATSFDLDTPADLAVLRHHPDCDTRLLSALQQPMLESVPVEQVLNVLRQEGSRVALVGRVSPLAWNALSKATQCWIRVFSEERGMVANERLARGEVQSLLARLLRMMGAEAFFAELAAMVDAAIIDSRVMMAAAGHYAPAADRYASDLFSVDLIEDEWLRDFTQAAANAPIPVVLGGHSVVAGGLYVLAEVLNRR